MSFRMKPMYEVLLCGSDDIRIGLYHLYKATPEQLCRLHYSPGSLKAVKARFKELVTQGYVVVNSVAVKHQTGNRIFWSARYFYTLAPPGVRYLARLGFDVDENWKPHNEADRHALFADHTLELNDVIIAAAQLRATDPRFYLESFRHELILKRHPYPVTLADGRASKVIPDAQLDFRRDGTTDHFLVLLEHDRGTEEKAVFMRKVQSYVAFVKAGGHVDAFDSTRVNICFTTFNGEARLEEMRQWTRQALVSEPPQIHRAFRFAALPQPLRPKTAWLEPRWYYPEDDQPRPLLAA
jgi:protein involved in plasmid replication-relaxation